MAAAHGRFIPKNPQKIIGDPNAIFFRSSWEVVAMKRFDQNPAVLKWGSEVPELAIPYLKPVINESTGRPMLKPARYFPDFVVIYKHQDGSIIRSIIEVKPLKEALDSKAGNAYDKLALAVNKAKWAAASAFCEKNGMTFQVVTERSLFIQAAQKPKTKPPKTTRKPTGTRKPNGTRR